MKYYCSDCKSFHNEVLKKQNQIAFDIEDHGPHTEIDFECPACKSDDVAKVEVHNCFDCQVMFPHELEQGLCEQCYDKAFPEEAEEVDAA